MSTTPRRQRVYEAKRLTGETVDELRREMQEELDNMALTLRELTSFNYLPQAQVPERYAEGTVIFFEAGVQIPGVPPGQINNPGLYQFYAGEWHRLNDTA